MWAPGGQARVAFGFTIVNGKTVDIELIADQERLRKPDLTVMDGRRIFSRRG